MDGRDVCLSFGRWKTVSFTAKENRRKLVDECFGCKCFFFNIFNFVLVIALLERGGDLLS